MAAQTPHSPPSHRPTRQSPPLPALDELDRTHAEMVAQLDGLKGLIDHLEAHGVDPVARQRAQQVCAYFASVARQHHADEESLVFPALLRRDDPALTQQVLRLQQDHGWLEEDWLELSPQLLAVAEGYSWYELDGLRHGVGVFATLYLEHIALEESLIYPQARQQLAAEQQATAQRIAARAA